MCFAFLFAIVKSNKSNERRTLTPYFRMADGKNGFAKKAHDTDARLDNVHVLQD